MKGVHRSCAGKQAEVLVKSYHFESSVAAAARTMNGLPLGDEIKSSQKEMSRPLRGHSPHHREKPRTSRSPHQKP